MSLFNTLAFLVFPYIALTVFVVGHTYRYFTDEVTWNARSSEFLDKESLKYPIIIFHWGIIFTLIGHAGGMLIPQRVFDAVGISGEAHTRLAVYSGFFIGLAALVGSVLLVRRRMTRERIKIHTSVNDWITIGGLVFVIAVGMYNVVFGHYYVLDTVAPWIRSILIFAPKPELMTEVPPSYKLHILSALALIGFSPFTRLVHIWSVPLGYVNRRYILFRRRAAGC